MSLERIKTVSAQIVSRANAVRGRGEEATKQALVLPMLDALGYDIWNPLEVCPEYAADFVVKRLGQKEKVDLAIVLNGLPRVYIEVKALDVSLDGHEGQLKKYFNTTPTVSLGILTNGVEWRFFTDTAEPNILDAEPFHISRLDAVEQGLDILARFQRSTFSPDSMRDFATELNYTAKISAFLRAQLDLRDKEPSPQFVKWVLAEEGSFAGVKTAAVVERFQPIVRESLQLVLREIIRRSFAALDNEVSAPASSSTNAYGGGNAVSASAPSEAAVTPSPAKDASDVQEDGEERSRINTTPEELEFFEHVKTIFGKSGLAANGIFDGSVRKQVPIELNFRDTTGYFGVYLNRPAYWSMRAVLSSKTPWIGFNLDPTFGQSLIPAGYTRLAPTAHAEFRIGIKSAADILALDGLVIASFKKVLQERQE